MKITIDDKTFQLVVKRAAFYKVLSDDATPHSEADIMETIAVIENELSEFLHGALGIGDAHIAEYWRLEKEGAA